MYIVHMTRVRRPATRERIGRRILKRLARAAASQARLQPFVLAYNMGNFLRRLCLPKTINDWSLRSLQVRLIKMGGRIVRHARRFVFQLAEVAVSRDLFAAILERITRLCPSPG